MIFAEFRTKHLRLKSVNYRSTNLCHGTITYILQTYISITNPVRVVNDDSIRSSEVYSESSGPRASEEDHAIRVSLEDGHLRLSLAELHLSVQPPVADGSEVHVVGQ